MSKDITGDSEYFINIIGMKEMLQLSELKSAILQRN